MGRSKQTLPLKRLLGHKKPMQNTGLKDNRQHYSNKTSKQQDQRA